MAIEAVIFDLDGTLADFNLDYRSVRVEVKNFLMKKGLPSSVLSTKENIFNMLDKTSIFLRNRDESNKTIEKILEEALKLAENREVEAAKKTSLFPGVPETLRILREKGLKIGLFTINSQKATEHILKRFRLVSLFSVIVPRDSLRHVKPSVDHLKAVLKVLEVDPDKAIVVGDSVNDMTCARELNVIAVGFPTGFSSNKELIDSGANYIITSIADLPALIDQIRKVPKR